MRSELAVAGFSGLVVALMVAASVLAQTTATPSLGQGIYTEGQAIRGQALYYEHCLACHGEAMTGLDQAPPLVGPQFSGTWDGEPLAALVERIDTMPPAKPGSLTRSQNVDILAYILWYNGLPIGNTQLDSEPGALARLTFRAPALFGE